MTSTAHQELDNPGTADGRIPDLRTDPRTNRRLLATLAQFDLDAPSGVPPVGRGSDPADIDEFLDGAHAGFEALYAAVPAGQPSGPHKQIDRRTLAIEGDDGNELTLHVFSPAGATGPLPAVVYIHGGGMTILDTDNNVHRTWCGDIASFGAIVIAVDFRNAHGPVKNPFPAGLNDCLAATRWIDAHRTELGISRLVLQGESGGANLAIAVALSARRQGRTDLIDGVYALVPYISGAYNWSETDKLAALPSLVENDGYFIKCEMLDLLVHAYDPDGLNARNPLAWPYFATSDDLTGLPPHVVSVNELDPLRDEGLAYARALDAAGVPVVSRINPGLTHGADSIFKDGASQFYRFTVADIHRFALAED
ncbi:alpha/beta hydrolase fold domain-containing protein [Gordonia sp. NPDC003376]